MRRITFLILLLFCNSLVGQLELPKYDANDTIVNHRGYTLSYNSKYKQANWVAYLLTGPSTSLRTNPSTPLRTNPSTSLRTNPSTPLRRTTSDTFRTGPSTVLRTGPSTPLRRTASASFSMHFERTNDFMPDPLIPGTDFSIDYKKSGYDRGHLAPAADMGYSMETMVESFFYSNMSPQLPRFNRGVWKKLEMQVRRWASSYDSLYVVTGPVFDSSMTSIGPHRIAVPKAYYKVLLQKRNGSWEGIGFIIPNSTAKVDFKNYATTIDKVEEITGIDFFHTLADEIEDQVEKVIGF